MNFKTSFSGLALLASLTASAYTYDLIGNDTPAGTTLESGFYLVNGVVKISAAEDPGHSALRIAPGATVTISIPLGSTLTVIGGDAEGMVGAGAGIEVPANSKLLLCGHGLLYAQGGSAAPGARGRAGEDGEMTAFFNVKLEDAENISEDDLPDPLICTMTGAGGDGGNGGGGAGAGIGGRGGRGGFGGKGGASHPVVSEELWNDTDDDDRPNHEVYEKWLGLLGHKREHVFLYDENDVAKLGVDGLPGEAGSDGKAGGKCGDIVIGESVQVMAIPGVPGAAGSGGPCGEAYSCPDLDSWTFSPVKMFFDGLEVLCASPEDEEDVDEEEEEEAANLEERRATLWAFGGGGGGGGAGGAGAPQGIGPGGAGGAGGGGAGGGLFAYGANASDDDEVWANGGAGLGGEGVHALTIEGEDGEEDTDLTTNGEDGEESDPINFYDAEFEEDEVMDFNVFTNDLSDVVWDASAWNGLVPEANLNRLCATSLHFYNELLGVYDDPILYWAGQGGAGGKAGKVLELGERKFRVSETAAVLVGLDAANQMPFQGEVILKLTLGSQMTEVPCGLLVTPVPVPEAEGRFFMGYYTEPDGNGEQYYDCLGFPVGQHELWKDMTLYPHFVSEKPVDMHKIELRFSGEEASETYESLASIWVMKGRTLPSIGEVTLDKIRGWRVTGAYMPSGSEEEVDDWWYDEDGSPIKEDEDGEPYVYGLDRDVVLHVTVEPKWEAMADMPEDKARFVYTGKGLSGIDLESDAYEFVSGTSVATNAGSYVTTIRLKEGYEIWDDFLLNPETATNEVRTVNWTIDRAELNHLTLPNRVYDWAKTNSTFEVVGKIPAGVTVTYETTKYLGNGTVEIKAVIDGGDNYRSKTMVATWAFPELLRIENVVSHYPWDTKVQLDVAANPLYAEGVYTNRLKSVIMPKTEDGYKFTDEEITVEDVWSDKGTIVLDLKEALANGRQSLKIYLALDDLPCSYAVEIAADTTAEMVKVGKFDVPTYTITDPAQMLPINHSWRIAAEAFHSDDAETSLTITRGGTVVTRAFNPVNPAGARVNEGVVGWVPQENGDYTLTLTVEEGRSTTRYEANFKVDYPAGTVLPVVAYVGETGYPTLAAAIEAATGLTGAARAIRLVGDVQTEEVALPDGADAIAVVYERGGVFDATRQFLAPENQRPIFNSVNALTHYTWEKGVDIVSVDTPPVPPMKAADDFKPVAIVGFPNGSAMGLLEICGNCNIAQVTTGVGALAGGSFVFTAYAVAEGRMSGAVMLRGPDGALQALPEKLSLSLYGTDDLKKDFAPCGSLELTNGAFEMPIPEGKSFFMIPFGL